MSDKDLTEAVIDRYTSDYTDEQTDIEAMRDMLRGHFIVCDFQTEGDKDNGE